MRRLQFEDCNLYLHPWNVVTLLIGLTLLIVGSYWYEAPDWDVPISIIMAGLSYLTAAWVMRVVLLCKWRQLPVALFLTWWTVDGCYAVYWHYANPEALALMREVNWPASLVLFGACGLIWNVPNLRRMN